MRTRQQTIGTNRPKSRQDDIFSLVKNPEKNSLINIFAEIPPKSTDTSIYRVRTSSGFILRGRYG